MSQESVVKPRQSRSKESFARVKLTVLELMRERGSADFTIAEVSEASGLAVGSIYGRVGNKAALVQLVQDEELNRIEAETAEALSSATPSGELRTDLAMVVHAYVGVLYSNRDILRATIRAAATDPAIAERGAQAGVSGGELFVTAIRRALLRNAEDASPEALDWVNELVYAVIARQFGIGILSTGAPAEPRPLEGLKTRLTDTVYLYLTSVS